MLGRGYLNKYNIIYCLTMAGRHAMWGYFITETLCIILSCSVRTIGQGQVSMFCGILRRPGWPFEAHRSTFSRHPIPFSAFHFLFSDG
jgi:hypothetical protein